MPLKQTRDRRHTAAAYPCPRPVLGVDYARAPCPAGAPCCLSGCRELATAPPSSPRCQEPPTMTGTRQKPAPPSRKKTPAALLSLLTSKPDTANDDTRRPAEVANDDRNRRRHTLYNIYSERQPPPCWLPSLHDRHPPPLSLLTSKEDTANDDSERERHPPPVVFIFRYLQENDKYICKRILKRQIYS